MENLLRTVVEKIVRNVVEKYKETLWEILRKFMKQILSFLIILFCHNVSKAQDYYLKNNGPYDLVCQVNKLGKLPVPNFSAGGIATPADAALMMQLGAESVFVGSGIFKSNDPENRAKAIELIKKSEKLSSTVLTVLCFSTSRKIGAIVSISYPLTYALPGDTL